jgi:hypothetical protein
MIIRNETIALVASNKIEYTIISSTKGDVIHAFLAGDRRER